MNTIVATKYGGPEVLQLKEVEKPTPKENEILIKVHATTVSAADFQCEVLPSLPRYGSPLVSRWASQNLDNRSSALNFPVKWRRLEKMLPASRSVHVFASTLTENFGGYAEYKCMPEKAMMTIKPDNMAYEEAAAFPIGATTALRLLRKGNIQRGQKVMIYGASGSVGTYAVQLAKYFGTEVTGVCSTSNLEMVKSLGADHVVDYTKEEFSSRKERYDVIFDTLGKFPKSQYSKVLESNGTYVSTAKLDTKESMDNLIYIKDLIEKGKIKQSSTDAIRWNIWSRRTAIWTRDKKGEYRHYGAIMPNEQNLGVTQISPRSFKSRLKVIWVSNG